MSNKNRILFVSHESSANGATRSLISLIRGLKRERPDVFCKVIIPAKIGEKGKCEGLYAENGISYRRLMYRRNFRRKDENYWSIKLALYDILNFFATIAIAFLIIKEKYEVVCSNSTAVDVGALAAFKTKRIHIQYVRELMEEDFGFEYRHKRVEKKIIEESDGVIFISNFVKAKYIGLYNVKEPVVIRNAVSVNDYLIKDHQILTSQKIRLIQIGVFSDGKGTKKTIEIMKQLYDSGYDNFLLTFVGEGDKEYISEMNSLINFYGLGKNIVVMGFVNDVRPLLAESDVLIMNSVAEGFGRVTVEAMIAGCLVVGKNAGGTREVIIDKNNGILFDDESDASQKLKDIFDNRYDYVAIASRGQKSAMVEYSEADTANKFLRYYERLEV